MNRTGGMSGVRRIIGSAAVVGLLGYGVMAAGGASASEDAKAEVSSAPAISADTACRQVYTGGSGEGKFVWCFTNTGNITRFEHPQGQNHIFTYVEGYTVCSANTVLAADNGMNSSGWGPPSYPAKTKVTRTMTNGKFRLEQTFSQTTNEKIITVTMKLTNISNATINDVRLMRHADFDVNNGPGGDYWFASAREVTAVDVNALSLRTTVSAPSPWIGMTPYTSSLPSSCTPTSEPQGDVGDNMAFTTYSLGSMAKGTSKTVKFIYDAQL